MTELEQLKQDHATIKAAFDIYMRDYKGCDWKAMTGIMEKKIAKLEAEADPWREAKSRLEDLEGMEFHWDRELARYVRHLESENARLKKENSGKCKAYNWLMQQTNATEDRVFELEDQLSKAKARIAELETELKAANEILRGCETKMTRIDPDARIAELEAREDPPLNRRRVYKTWWTMAEPRDWKDVEPYPLQEPK